MISSIALNKDWDIAVTETDAGLTTIQLACDHRVNSQLFRSGLIASKQNRQIENQYWIDWDIFTDLNAPFELLAIKILALGNSFDGIESVDITNAEYETTNGYLDINGICFTSDCAHSKLDCEVSI